MYRLIPLFIFVGCKKTDGPIAWALDYATVTPQSGELDGVHVWEFFSEGWEKKQDPEYFQCAVVQSVAGSGDSVPQGCERCTAYYSVALAEQSTDCDGSLTSDPALIGLRGFGIGSVDGAFSGDDPYPGDSLGWFISFDGVSAEFHGFAFAEALERGEDVLPGWIDGQVYTLWPAYTWSL